METESNSSEETDYSGEESDSEEEEEEAVEEKLEDMIIKQGGNEATQPLLNLPLDIFLNIISRLPIKCLAVSRCVCKTWLNIVHHPVFTEMHHTRAMQQPHHTFSTTTSLVFHTSAKFYLLEHEMDDSLENGLVVSPTFTPSVPDHQLVGSSNGLLCLSAPVFDSRLSDFFQRIFVCNPVSGEYTALPKTTKVMGYDTMSGFGFDVITGEYKVISIITHIIKLESQRVSSFKVEAELYALGSGEWRDLGDIPYPLYKQSPQVFVDGALHWIIQEYVGQTVSDLIVAFNVGREEFQVIPSPAQFTSNCDQFLDLGDLGGNLCLCDDSIGDRYEIWIMKEYGLKDSWTKEYVISLETVGFRTYSLIPLKLMGNGNILLVVNEEAVLCYDPARRTSDKLGIPNIPPKFHAITHVGSFVSVRNIMRSTNRKYSVSAGKWYKNFRRISNHNPGLI